MHQLEIADSVLEDPFYQFDPEYLPDGRKILTMDIRKALNGDDYRIYPVGESRSVVVEGVDSVDFSYYMKLFLNYENFGLPHGKGWLNELPWTLDFLSSMKATKQQIEQWRAR